MKEIMNNLKENRAKVVQTVLPPLIVGLLMFVLGQWVTNTQTLAALKSSMETTKYIDQTRLPKIENEFEPIRVQVALNTESIKILRQTCDDIKIELRAIKEELKRNNNRITENKSKSNNG
jgi:hypothetical protein